MAIKTGLCFQPALFASGGKPSCWCGDKLNGSYLPLGVFDYVRVPKEPMICMSMELRWCDFGSKFSPEHIHTH